MCVAHLGSETRSNELDAGTTTRRIRRTGKWPLNIANAFPFANCETIQYRDKKEKPKTGQLLTNDQAATAGRLIGPVTPVAADEADKNGTITVIKVPLANDDKTSEIVI